LLKKNINNKKSEKQQKPVGEGAAPEIKTQK